MEKSKAAAKAQIFLVLMVFARPVRIALQHCRRDTGLCGKCVSMVYPQRTICVRMIVSAWNSISKRVTPFLVCFNGCVEVQLVECIGLLFQIGRHGLANVSLGAIRESVIMGIPSS